MEDEITIYEGASLHKGQIKIRDGILSTDTKFNVINAARQSGKSFLLIQLLMYYSINFKSSILVVSPFISQNLKIFDNILYAISKSGVIRKTNRSEKQIELINGSTILFKSAEVPDAIRGGSFDYVFCDEFAYYKADAWSMAIRPTMAAKKHSKAFLFSTPRGKNEFYDMAVRGQSNEETNKAYQYYYMSYEDNPLYDIDFVNDCKKHYPLAKFQQEFLGHFIDSASVFDYLKCATLTSYPELRGVKYYAGLDLARKKDKTVLTVMDSEGTVVCIYAINGTSWDSIVNNVVAILQKYKAHCIVEINSIGDVVYELIEKKYRNISPIFTSNSSKQEYIEDLIYAFNSNNIIIPDKNLCEDLHIELDVFEMTYSPKTRKIVYAARQGFHDDYVISLALANKSIKKNANYGDYYVF